MKLIALKLVLCFTLFACNMYSQRLDLRLLDKINGEARPHRDIFYKAISRSAAPISIVSPFVMLAAGNYFYNTDAIKKSYYVGTSLLLTTILTTTLKYTIKRQRPFVDNEFICKKCNVGALSFPSGHTSTAFATATALSLAYPEWYVIGPSFLWASTVAYSRMHLGVHYPSDVLGGMVIGIGVSYILWEVEKKLINN